MSKHQTVKIFTYRNHGQDNTSQDTWVVNDAVATQPSLTVLFKEYHKYWLRGLAALLGI